MAVGLIYEPQYRVLAGLGAAQRDTVQIFLSILSQYDFFPSKAFVFNRVNHHERSPTPGPRSSTGRSSRSGELFTWAVARCRRRLVPRHCRISVPRPMNLTTQVIPLRLPGGNADQSFIEVLRD